MWKYSESKDHQDWVIEKYQNKTHSSYFKNHSEWQGLVTEPEKNRQFSR